MYKREEMLKKYAKLIVTQGVQIQKGQRARIDIDVEHHQFAKYLVDELYQQGAKSVTIDWSFPHSRRAAQLFCDVETLTEVPNWVIEKMRYNIEVEPVLIAISSPRPHFMDNIDSKKSMEVGQILMKHPFNKEIMANSRKNKVQWVIAALPTAEWAKQVFPDLQEEEGKNLLLDKILQACYLDENVSACELWQEHTQKTAELVKKLDDNQIVKLHYTNSIGTDFTVELVDGHVWVGGIDKTRDGKTYCANIPSEEVFTCPNKNSANGRVYSSKPLMRGKHIIRDFFFDFENGKVVNYDAKEGKEGLDELFTLDENAKYLGEVALVGHNTPISMMGIMFYSTLFDENASCHLALGSAIPQSVPNWDGNEETAEKMGINNARSHTDFMIGTADMKIVGITKDGKEIVIMENGNIIL